MEDYCCKKAEDDGGWDINVDSKGKSSCHCHNGDGDSSSVHVDGCTKRNGYGIGVTVEPHLLTGFHIYWNIGSGTSGEECGDGTFLQAVQNQRIWIKF